MIGVLRFLIVIVAIIIYAFIAWRLLKAYDKWAEKRKRERLEKFCREFDARVERAVWNSIYGIPYDLSKVEDVEYEDVSGQKLIKK